MGDILETFLMLSIFAAVIVAAGKVFDWSWKKKNGYLQCKADEALNGLESLTKKRAMTRPNGHSKSHQVTSAQTIQERIR